MTVGAHPCPGDEADDGAPEQASCFVAPGSLAARYLACLLEQDKASAMQLIDDALAQGLTIRELYLTVIQQTQYEVGRLWERNQISVAEEHFCTGVSQLLIARLYPSWLVPPAPDAPRAVVACVEWELHELGARMVADFLEMAGWDTVYLGASAPPAAVAALLRGRRTHVLAISSTMTTNFPAVERMIEVVHELPKSVRPRIIVGGYAFRQEETMWRRLGADGYARDADEAVGVACALASAPV